jgi:hypothetical protein
MSFLVIAFFCSIVAVGLTLACFLHELKMPVLKNNAAAMMIFFMIIYSILCSRSIIYVWLIGGADVFSHANGAF